MSLQVQSGRVLLQNTDDGLWYYLDSYTQDGNTYIRVWQTPSTALGAPSAYAIIEAENGAFYKLFTLTVGSEIHYDIELLAGTQIADDFRIVDAVTGRYYTVTVGIVNNQAFAGLSNTGSEVCVPWKLFSVSTAESRRGFTPVTAEDRRSFSNATAVARRSISSASAVCQRDVALP